MTAISTQFRHALLCFCLLVSCLASGGRAIAASPEGHPSAIPFEDASVASQDGRVFDISWRAPGVHHVEIYAGQDRLHVARVHAVADGAGEGQAHISGLPAAARWYFELVPDHGDPLVVADRSLHLSTAANFRDIGGYRAQDGKWVRMGLAYRSNELDHLTAQELEILTGLGLKLDCDLRTDEERTRGPDRLPSGVQLVPADVLADDAQKIHAMMTPAAPGSVKSDPAADAQAIYRDFVRTGSAERAYHILFEKLADPTALPTVFHCSAGKDRTGWADAILLTILGVPRATIVADYALTNQYLRGEALKTLQARFQSSELGKRPLSADTKELDTAFDEVGERYGTFDNYLHRGLGLDDATLDKIRVNFLAD